MQALQSHDIITTLECEQFLQSQWFNFMSDMNGEKLIKMMREEFA